MKQLNSTGVAHVELQQSSRIANEQLRAKSSAITKLEKTVREFATLIANKDISYNAKLSSSSTKFASDLKMISNERDIALASKSETENELLKLINSRSQHTHSSDGQSYPDQLAQLNSKLKHTEDNLSDARSEKHALRAKFDKLTLTLTERKLECESLKCGVGNLETKVNQVEKEKLRDEFKITELELQIEKLALLRKAKAPPAVCAAATSPIRIKKAESACQTQQQQQQQQKQQQQNYGAELGEVIQVEMKAIQSHSHILNLTKQASMREATILNTELKIRLQAAKSQQDILLFSVSAFEQALLKHDAPFVTKFAKSRSDRIRDLKSGLQKNLQELEQRSSRTIFETADRLINIDLPRAKKNWVEATDKREKLVKMID